MTEQTLVLLVDDEPDDPAAAADALEGERDRFRVAAETAADGGLDRLADGDVLPVPDCRVVTLDPVPERLVALRALVVDVIKGDGPGDVRTLREIVHEGEGPRTTPAPDVPDLDVPDAVSNGRRVQVVHGCGDRDDVPGSPDSQCTSDPRVAGYRRALPNYDGNLSRSSVGCSDRVVIVVGGPGGQAGRPGYRRSRYNQSVAVSATVLTAERERSV